MIRKAIRGLVDNTDGNSQKKLKSIDDELAIIKGRASNARNAMENGVDPSFVIESLQGIEKERNVLMEQRLQIQNSSVYIDITDNDCG